MKRRDALRSLSMAGGASLLSTRQAQLQQALTPEIPSGFSMQRPVIWVHSTVAPPAQNARTISGAG